MAHTLTLQDWLDRLRPGQTPIFQHTKTCLLALRDRLEQIGVREVTSLILADPLACLRLIYLANNRVSRHFASDVATVEHAVMMQGLGVYLDKVATFPVIEEAPIAREPDSLASLYRLLRLAQHAAWQARDFAVLHSDVRAEEVEVAALLYYAPEFLFWLDAPDTARELARLRRSMEPQAAERQVLGFELEPLRLMLLEAWRIPEVIRDMLDARYMERSRNTILHACLDIAHRSRYGWWNEKLMADYEALAGIEGTPVEVVITTVHRNAVRVAHHGAWIPAPPAAAWLPMLPGLWPHEQPAAESRPANEDAAVSAQPGAAAPDSASVCLAPDPAALKSVVEQIEQHLDSSLNLNQMLALVLKGLHHGLGLSRVVFAMVTPDGQRVKSRFTLGIGAQEPLRHFEFPLQSPDLFGRLMTKMQAVWVNADNQVRLWPMVRPELKAMIGEGEFLAMSLYVGDKPFGLIYGDRGRAGCRLDAPTYEGFKSLCLLASRGLTNLKKG